MICEGCGQHVPYGKPYVAIDYVKERLHRADNRFGAESVPEDTQHLLVVCMSCAPTPHAIGKRLDDLKSLLLNK